jgi:hypothetical protein
LITVDIDILELFVQYSGLIMVHDSVEEKQMINMLKKVKVTHPRSAVL